MPKSIAERSPHTTAILAVLQSTGIPADAGTVPDGAGWQGAPGTSDFHAYLVLHSIPGGNVDGSLAYPDDDSDWVWQVTAVGDTHALCEVAGDIARTALLTTLLDVEGRGTRRVTIDTPDGARRDETVKPPVFMSGERYRVATTPA